MKERELSKLIICSCCNQPVTHTKVPLFWKIKVERFGLNLKAIERQRGLGAFLGSIALASVMGPDEDLATPVMETKEISLCEQCAVSVPVAIALECKDD